MVIIYSFYPYHNINNTTKRPFNKWFYYYCLWCHNGYNLFVLSLRGFWYNLTYINEPSDSAVNLRRIIYPNFVSISKRFYWRLLVHKIDRNVSFFIFYKSFKIIMRQMVCLEPMKPTCQLYALHPHLSRRRRRRLCL